MKCVRYEIMLDCWQTCPDSRPSFKSIVNKLGNILENSEEYLEMQQETDVRDASKIVNNDNYSEYVNNLGENDPLLIPW